MARGAVVSAAGGAGLTGVALPSHWNVVAADTADAWLKARTGFLTASDVSGVLGLNRWKSRASVVRAKIAALSGVADEPNRFVAGAMMAGQFQEQGVFDWFLYDRRSEAVSLGEDPPTGSICRNPLGTSVLVSHPRSELQLAASPDGLMVLGDGSRQLVEIKVLGPEGSYLRWHDPCKSQSWKAMKRDAELGCPVPHFCQLQTQLLCCGEEFGWVVGCCGTKKMEHPFPFDADLARRIEDATVEFWGEVQRG